MSTELWSAIFSGATFIVIAATALAAMVQLRHLRASNQLNALLTLMKLWQAPDLQEHIKYARTELQQKLRDPAFLEEFGHDTVSRIDHPEMLVADFWEQVGAFMKFDLMDERSWLDVAGPQAVGAWQLLEPIIRSIRRTQGLSSYENFEFAAVRAQLWMDRHPQGFYPSGTPRMDALCEQRVKKETLP